LFSRPGGCSRRSRFFQAEDGIRDGHVTGVQTCALPICMPCIGKWYTSTHTTMVERCRLEWARCWKSPSQRIGPPGSAGTSNLRRSEERRVGKECRCRWSLSHLGKEIVEVGERGRFKCDR